MPDMHYHGDYSGAYHSEVFPLQRSNGIHVPQTLTRIGSTLNNQPFYLGNKTLYFEIGTMDKA
ncbi:hypothetical protein BSPLISOX_2189 [uncultured Gammaproteobacteria bacterium]|jgi:hypothetical protein|nr:hypothetical protein BSPLISOX_2189 [uncultured Gammaproteobacteria bacterium]